MLPIKNITTRNRSRLDDLMKGLKKREIEIEKELAEIAREMKQTEKQIEEQYDILEKIEKD
jgi:hypothetical protein